jgi:hypothetical protein
VVQGNGCVVDGRHEFAPAFPHYAFMLSAGYVELQHLHNRKRISCFLVDALQTLAREVDQLLNFVVVYANTVNDVDDSVKGCLLPT